MHRAATLLLLAGVFCGATGCDLASLEDWDGGAAALNDDDADASPYASRKIPPHVKGTVTQHARLSGRSNLPVHGFGLVVGLGKDGSSEVPPHLKKYMSEYLSKQKIGSWTAGTQAVSPERMLRDKDTTVVMIGGSIPPCAPKGTKFDLFLRSIPGTNTRSLEGGVLLPAELQLSFGRLAVPGTRTRTLGSGSGTVFTNPFVDTTNPKALAKLRKGRVLGGGTVTFSRPIKLVLYRPDYGLADRLQRRINQRFGARTKVANAENRSEVEIAIPPERRDDYRHFLDLLMHLSLRSGPGALETHAREVGAAMERPDADHEKLALVWEAMGREILPVVQELYTSRNPAASFHAARAGLRLGDTRQAPDVLIRFARSTNSAHQVPAIRELGRHPEVTRARSTLRSLINAENDLVCIAAYEALLAARDTKLVERHDVGGEFYLDVVASKRDYVVYATRSEQPRIVLFGRHMPVARPVFYTEPDDLVTVNAFKDSKQLTVFRTLPQRNKVSDTFRMDFDVATLVRKLGSAPRHGLDGKIMGLGLTYAQVVRVLHGMCEARDINAKFALQPLDEERKIFERTTAVGRPD